jgi:hypothetical protein
VSAPAFFARYSYNKTDTITPSLCPPASVRGRTIDPTCTDETSALPLMEMRPTTIAAVGETQWVPLQVYNRTKQVAGSITKARGSHNFNRRYRDGLAMTSHCTWSHARQFTPAPWDFSQMEWGDTQQFDVRHRFVATASYELPWGKSLTGVAHGFLAAGQVNVTGYLQSGVAYTVVNATSQSNTGNNAGP